MYYSGWHLFLHHSILFQFEQKQKVEETDKRLHSFTEFHIPLPHQNQHIHFTKKRGLDNARMGLSFAT